MFKTGLTFITQGVQELVNDNKLTLLDVFKLVDRHSKEDWAELNEQDQNQNHKALINGGRVIGAYTVNEVRLWVITEAGHDLTTVILPSEY